MGERKVLNKYYPPDFDPSKIPRIRQPKNRQMNVRMMLPMSIRCGTCGNYIYKGTKFNSRKEDVIGETYLGIQIFRFYFKCSKCSAEITYKTDPKNSDYVVESGATRNFEPWRDADEIADEAKRKRVAEEMGDAMKALENRTIDSKREMDILAALDEMKSMRSRHAGVDTKDMLEVLKQRAELKEKELEEADEALIRSMVFQTSDKYVHKLNDDDIDDDDDGDFLSFAKKSRVGGLMDAMPNESNLLSDNPKPTAAGGLRPSFVVKHKNAVFNGVAKTVDKFKEAPQQIKPEDLQIKCEHQQPEIHTQTGLDSLCASYDGDSDN